MDEAKVLSLFPNNRPEGLRLGAPIDPRFLVMMGIMRTTPQGPAATGDRASFRLFQAGGLWRDKVWDLGALDCRWSRGLDGPTLRGHLALREAGNVVHGFSVDARCTDDARFSPVAWETRSVWRAWQERTLRPTPTAALADGTTTYRIDAGSGRILLEDHGRTSETVLLAGGLLSDWALLSRPETLDASAKDGVPTVLLENFERFKPDFRVIERGEATAEALGLDGLKEQPVRVRSWLATGRLPTDGWFGPDGELLAMISGAAGRVYLAERWTAKAQPVAVEALREHLSGDQLS